MYTKHYVQIAYLLVATYVLAVIVGQQFSIKWNKSDKYLFNLVNAITFDITFSIKWKE